MFAGISWKSKVVVRAANVAPAPSTSFIVSNDGSMLPAMLVVERKPVGVVGASCPPVMP